MKPIDNLLELIEKDIDNPSEKQYFWTHQVRYFHILSYIQQMVGEKKITVLDIGCFPYHIGKGLELLGHNVYGIASEHEPIKKKQISILNIEKERFPYKDNFFDLVLCNEVIEHLPQSPIPALREILRVTKKEGQLMVTTPNIARSINRFKLLFGNSVMYSTDVYSENNGKGNTIYHRHNREYTLHELKKILEKVGWGVTKSGYFISYTPFRKRTVKDSWYLFLGKLVNYFFMLLFPPMQDTLLLLGKK